MRRVERGQLSVRVESYLAKKQSRVDAGYDVHQEWESARQTKTIGRDLYQVLLSMAGIHERCMYCNDSRGTDIEHFRPKARSQYPDYAFQWGNMLLACTGCNRKKSDKFPVDAAGVPLLIDPSSDDPWEFLEFIPATGELAPIWRNEVGGFDPKGDATTNPDYLPLNIEAVTVGRQKTFRLLRQHVIGFLRQIDDGDGLDDTLMQLILNIREHSGYGLERWIFLEGQIEEPFSILMNMFPECWVRLQNEFA